MKGMLLDNETGDLLIEKGAVAIGNCEEQIVEIVLVANRGEIKEVPLIGAEIELMLSCEKDILWPLKAKRMIKACGVEVSKISITDDNIITVE
jgi:hypothetical protein